MYVLCSWQLVAVQCSSSINIALMTTIACELRACNDNDRKPEFLQKIKIWIWAILQTYVCMPDGLKKKENW